MPHSSIGVRAKPGSNTPANSPPKAAPQGPQFTKSKQSFPPNGPDRPESSPDDGGKDSAERLSPEERSPEELSLDATEPFPPGLFRIPVPDAVFAEMPSMSDSALRCLLALIHLSFRFDPASGEWVHPGDFFSRSDVEGACGLSSQGTRNGLEELEALGWAEVDRQGHSHQHKLLSGVPDRRYTYVPTALLEGAGEIASGAELRVVLAVLRRTWGWTCRETDPESGRARTVHDRWTRLSNRELAAATGRSETAVGQAAKALQGEWIERVRPGHGAYQYRFLPEAVGDGSGKPDSFSGNTSNDLPPDRQNSAPLSSNKESLSRDKQSQPLNENKSPSRKRPHRDKEPPAGRKNAVPTGKKRQRGPKPVGKSQTPSQKSRPEPPATGSSDLPPEKQDLAEKLHNAGVWAGRIPEILSRYSAERIEANFELFRQRDMEQTIRKPGAWLCQAITEGYALPPSSSPQSIPPQGNAFQDGGASSPNGSSSPGSSPGPLPKHKQVLSEEKMEAHVRQGVPRERFQRCLSEKEGRHYMYFASGEGGPNQRAGLPD